MIKKLLLFIFLNVIVISVNAKLPIKFGKISKQSLLMKSYPKDTSASAVILCDYGEFNPDIEIFEFTRTIRIKVLKKDGVSLANWSFSGSEKSLVRGRTYNLVDGKIEETKLSNDDIFRERVYDEYYRLRVSMPDVKVGSVVDIEYTFKGLPSVWYFQYDIPVLHSELVIYDNQYIDYTKNYYGFLPLSVNESTRWVVENAPAFKKEPYMNYYKNYVSKFEIEITSIHVPELNYYKNFSISWENIRSTLYQNQFFGGKLAGNGFLKDIADEIKAKHPIVKDQICAAVDTIKSVKWDNKKRL